MADSTLNKKSLKLSVNAVRQKDGSVIERLDMTALPGAGRDERVPGTPAEWLARMADPTRNGLIVKQPHLLAEWLDAITEPRFMTALATMALDPVTYPRTLNRLADPATARNWAEFVDPEVFIRWMAAGMDPTLYQAVFQHMFDPKKYLRWAAYVGSYAMPASGGSNNPEQSWSQLPTREPRNNPWLVHSHTYRY